MSYDELRGITDTHAHLSYLSGRVNEHDWTAETLARAEYGFVLDIGTDANDLAGRVSQFQQYKNVRFAAGIWPHREALPVAVAKVAELEAQINAAPSGLVAAIGECGYDRRENPDSSEGETALLELQLELARRRGLPVIIHSRERPEETIATLRRFPGVQGIIHCYSYGKHEGRIFLDMGFHISFAGNLTFKNAQNLHEAAAFVPDDRLLLETDCPFLAPVPHRGKPCHPAMILETYKFAASLRSTSVARLKTLVAENARLLFKAAPQ